jgi:hypothetical protein
LFLFSDVLCLLWCRAELSTFALQAKVDAYGPDSEQLVDVLLLLAEAYRALANYDEAETFLNQVRHFLVSLRTVRI